MSERYTVEYGEDARLVMIVNHDTKDAYTVFQACRELNRLAAEVETLRELLIECQPAIYHDDDIDLCNRIDDALKQSGETP